MIGSDLRILLISWGRKLFLFSLHIRAHAAGDRHGAVRGDPCFRQARVSALHSKYINNHTAALHYIMNMWKHFYYFDRISEPKKKLSDLSASGKQLH